MWIGIGFLLMQGTSLFEKMKIFAPAIIILIGVLLGPFGLDFIHIDEVNSVLTELVLVFILFSAGLEICWPRFLTAIRPGLLVGVGGIVLSFGFGFAATYSLGSAMEEALYIGVALTATSIGISVPLLSNSGLLTTRVGQILLASAIVDDIAALYFLSALHVGLSDSNGYFAVIISLMIGAMTVVIAALSVYAFHFAVSKIDIYRHKNLRILMLALIALITALVTHLSGLSSALGGFIGGASLALRHCSHLKEDILFFKRLAEYISPLFFLSIGMQITKVDISNQHLMVLTVVILFAAIAGKFSCTWLVANQLNVSEQRLLGVALIPRGEVGLIVAGIGLQQKHLSDHGMVALVLMTLVTTVMATVLIPRLAQTIHAQD